MTGSRFAALAQLFKRLERISGHAARDALAVFFRGLPREDVPHTAFLCTGRIASEFEDVDLGMADKMVLRAVGEAAGVPDAELRRRFKRVGDVGVVAQEAIGRAEGRLTLGSVFLTLRRIAATGGKDSQSAKIRLFAGILRDASPLEAKYVCRLALGNLRLGIGDKTVLDALAKAYGGSKVDLEQAYNVCPDIGVIAETLVRKGVSGVRRIGVHVGRPIQSMLCQRIKSLDELPRRMRFPVVVEEKYDGERIQAHINGGRITLYSRRLEDITAQFPDVVAAIRRQVSVRSAVIDGEAMPIDGDGNFLPFQTLMSRRRKHHVAQYSKSIPVVWCVFDMMFRDGKSLIGKPYPSRWQALSRCVRKGKGIRLAARTVCADIDCVEEMFGSIISRGGEGIIIKSLDKGSSYQAGVRGWHWIKWKPEYIKGLRDTFDLVVVGAYLGRGKRAGRYGALLCAAYNAERGRFETFCKVGTGFSDKDLAALPRRLDAHRIRACSADVVVAKGMHPDVWFSPAVVCEVSGANVTRSPNHSAGAVDGKGLALRFPRFIRWRDEKGARQATTVREIKKMR